MKGASMTPTQMPGAEHVEFDTICEQVREFEPLPTVTTKPPEPDEDQTGPIDALILATLVSP
jgi:hypothetical protein